MEFIATSVTQNDNDSQDIAESLDKLTIQTLAHVTTKKGGEV